MKLEGYLENAIGSRLSDKSESRIELSQSISQGKITLLLGAGVTRCLVGDWTELLNELSLMRCGSVDDISLRELRNYIENNTEYGKFLPSATDVLEQGEYLMVDIDDPEASRPKNFTDNLNIENETWQEGYFASQVREAIERLKKRNLCIGENCSLNLKDLKREFLDWCDNIPDDKAFNIPRRDLASQDKIKKILSSKSADEIICYLNTSHNLKLEISALRKILVSTKCTNEEKLSLLSNILVINEKIIKKVIHDTLNINENFEIMLLNNKERSEIISSLRINSKGKVDDILKNLLIQKSCIIINRPDLGTLYAVLKLCINQKIKNVINYNFDTVFEELLNDSDVQIKLGRSVSEAKIQVRIYSSHFSGPIPISGFCKNEKEEDAVNIYHVHGIVHKELEIKPIIFSENSYKSYQNIEINWSNSIFLRMMSTSNIFCVGFSGTDSNFRHIMRLYSKGVKSALFSAENNYKIFLTRCMNNIITTYKGSKKDVTDEEKQIISLCLKTYLNMTEIYYSQQFNIKIIWTLTFDDMANLIRKL